ncbi:MAG: hypothetical protein HC875_12640 [Anaerolineales bacterium]|nr:hypothetical protein [Anaerolineales bacterium]
MAAWGASDLCPQPQLFCPRPALAKQLVFEIQSDPDFRRRNLERGNAHLDIWPEDPALTFMENNENVTVFVTNPARFVLRLVPNLSAFGSGDPAQPHPVLANPKIREAIRAAIDVNRLNEEAFLGRAIPIDTELSQLGCQLAPTTFNPGVSIALIDQAGWRLTNPDDPIRYCQGCGTVEDGTPLVLKSYIYEEFGEELVTAHRLIEEMLLEVGIKLEREVVEGGQLWNTWENNGIELRGNFDLDLWDDGYYGVDPTLIWPTILTPAPFPPVIIPSPASTSAAIATPPWAAFLMPCAVRCRPIAAGPCCVNWPPFFSKTCPRYPCWPCPTVTASASTCKASARTFTIPLPGTPPNGSCSRRPRNKIASAKAELLRSRSFHPSRSVPASG